MNKLIKSSWIIIAAALIATGCSSPRKAELSSGSVPASAIAEVTQIMASAQQGQLDVLADEEYTKGSHYLDEAKRALKEGEPSETILENAGISKAFFQDASKKANARQSFTRRILKARKSAMIMGGRLHISSQPAI